MRKITCLIIICFSVFIASVMLTTLNLYVSGDPVFQSLNEGQIVRGHIHPVLLTKSFWSAYPQMPPLPLLIHMPTLLFVGFILLILWARFGVKKQLPSIWIALLSLSAAVIPYAVGLWALADNASQTYAYKWLFLMQTGVVYCSLSAALLAVLDCINVNVFKFIARMPAFKVSLEHS